MPYPTRDRGTDSIIKSLIDRQAEGQRTYGVTLAENETFATNPLNWLNECQEELLDAIQYIEKYKQDLDTTYSAIIDIAERYSDITDHDNFMEDLYAYFYPSTN